MPNQDPQDTLVREVFVPSLVKAANARLSAKGLPTIQNDQGVREALEIADLIERAGQHRTQETPLSKAASAVSHLRQQVQGDQSPNLSPEVVRAALASK